MPSDRKNHLAAGAGELVGELHPGGGGADHEHSPGRQLCGVAVRGGRQDVDARVEAVQGHGSVRAT